MEASLTCAVCLSMFDNPTTLPVCSHNFCKKCILECVTKAFCPGTGGGNVWRNSQLECPLCRKTNVIAEGAVNLPGNTTLAEVVKLYRSQSAAGGQREPAEGLGAGEPGGGRALCLCHSPRSLQLFCRVCGQAACGRCVSEHHRGVFHSVNLVDAMYQEEKLDYLNNLRELRQLNERLKVEVADVPLDVELILEYEKEVVKSKFDEISEKLDLKRKQLIEKIEKQIECKRTERNACLARKQTQKDTVKKYLEECEKLVNECNPVNFLKVACDLNERVRSNLAIIHLALKSHNESGCLQPSEFHIKPVLDSISALQLTKGAARPHCSLDIGNTTNKIVTEGYRFKTPLKMWNKPEDFKEAKFSELRYKYYQSYRKDWKCFMNEECSGDVNSADPSVSSGTSAILEKADGIKQHPIKLFDFGRASKLNKKWHGKHLSNLKLQLSYNSRTINSNPSISNIDILSSSKFSNLPNRKDASLHPDSAAAITKPSVSNSEKLSNISNLSPEQKKREDIPVPSALVESETISSSLSKTLPPTGETVSCPATSTSAIGKVAERNFATKVVNEQPTSTASIAVFEKHHGIEQHPISRFDFGHFSKKKKKKCYYKGNLEPKLSCDSGIIPRTPPISNIEVSSSRNFSKLPNMEDASLTHDSAATITRPSVSNSERLINFSNLCPEGVSVPSVLVEPETISSISSTVKMLPTTSGTMSFPATSTSCKAVPVSDKTDEDKMAPFSFAGSMLTKCSELPHAPGTSRNSKFNSGPVRTTITSDVSNLSALFSRSAIGKTDKRNLATKVGNEQAVLTSSFMLDKPTECSFRSSSASLTGVFHNKVICDSSGKNVHHDNGQTSTISSATYSGKDQSFGTESAFSFLKTTEEYSLKHSSKSFISLNSVGPSGDQSKMIPVSSATERSESLFTSFPNTQFSAKSTESSSNQKSSCSNGLVLSNSDTYKLLTLAQSNSDVPNLNIKPVLPLDESSVFKLKNLHTVTPTSSLFTFSSTPCADVFKQARSIKPPNHSNSSSEVSWSKLGKSSTSSIPEAFTVCFGQQLSAGGQQQRIVKPLGFTKVKKDLEVPIVAEPPKHNYIHLSGSKDENLLLAVREQQRIDEISTKLIFEKNALQTEKWLDCKSVEFHETKPTNSLCVDFSKELSFPPSQQQTSVAPLGVVVETRKLKETATFEVPISMQQPQNDNESDSVLQSSKMRTSLENSSEKNSKNLEINGKIPPVFSDQINDVQEIRFSENPGHNPVHQNPTSSSDFCPPEHESKSSDKVGLTFQSVRKIILEPQNLSSHRKDFALVPQSIASKNNSLGEANNVTTKAEIVQITATDCPLATVSAGFCPIFTFGAGHCFQFKMGVNGHAVASGENEEKKGDCKIRPKPMYPFPPPADSPPTAINAEDTLFSNQAKFYYFEWSSLQWKERAFGEIRILQHRVTKLPRLVVWNTANKCCANHWITSDLELKQIKNNIHNWAWSALDYSENKQTYLQFAVHFKMKETAEMFKKVFEKVQSTIEVSESTENNLCSVENVCDQNASFDVASDLKEEIKTLQDGDEDVVILSEVTPTPEQRALALKLLLPPTFFCYKNKTGYQSSDDEEDEYFETAIRKLGGQLYPNQN
ncbi:uncharacterized protein [Narcine bancroftii]|uniref:uncharacterized protein isoform X2 n=1 Tax=Narcine bancroftii TaxID=1343680 RepID=UPI0038314EA3